MCAGVFGSVVLPSRPSVASSPEQGESTGRSAREPPSGIYGHAFTSAHVESDGSPEPEELSVAQVRLKRTDGLKRAFAVMLSHMISVCYRRE